MGHIIWIALGVNPNPSQPLPGRLQPIGQAPFCYHGYRPNQRRGICLPPGRTSCSGTAAMSCPEWRDFVCLHACLRVCWCVCTLYRSVCVLKYHMNQNVTLCQYFLSRPAENLLTGTNKTKTQRLYSKCNRTTNCNISEYMCDCLENT